MNLFAPGTKNNPNEKARKEQEDFQKWQLAENARLQKEQERFIAARLKLMASMTEEEWEEFLEMEAVENAQKRAGNTEEYETR
jgi:hypothetical protein